MLNLFKTSPADKLEKKLRKKTEEALAAQRAGKMPRFAELSAEADRIRAELEQLESEHNG